MSHDTTETGSSIAWPGFAEPEQEPLLHLAIAWSLDEPSRIGEVATLDGDLFVLGRGEPEAGDARARAQFFRQRPAISESGGPLSGSRISRAQLLLRPSGDGLDVQSIGRCPLLVNGVPTDRAVVQEGDSLTLKDALVLMVVRRPKALPGLRNYAGTATFSFGSADAHGLVGESPLLWQLRDELAFAARSRHHVLVHGDTGVGKELAVHAIHALSPRADRKLVTYNAASLPASISDGELFASAEGGTLFLDEVAELPERVQAELLRWLDQPSASPEVARAETGVRVIAATNRPLAGLRPDFLARFAHRLYVAGLDERREDIPLFVRFLLGRAALGDVELGRRFFEQSAGRLGEARLDPMLVEGLLRHRYTAHVRELERLLWVSLATSPGTFVGSTPEFRAEISVLQEAKPTPEISRVEIEAALLQSEGNVTVATRLLGLKNRFVLYRLIKRHGIVLRES